MQKGLSNVVYNYLETFIDMNARHQAVKKKIPGPEMSLHANHDSKPRLNTNVSAVSAPQGM